MATTPVYALPYQTLVDIPQGAALGENLADAVEVELARIDTLAAARLGLAQIALVSVTITPVANTVTSAAVSWGKTLSGTVRAIVTAETSVPGSVFKEATISGVTSTGATVYIMRSNTTNTTIHVMAVGGV